MQKKILALAVAGLMSGAAFAQSNVTISGLLDVAYENQRVNGGTLATTSGVSRHGLNTQTSFIRFSGTEDLGGGLRALWQVENGVSLDGRSDQGALQFGGRDSWLALQGGFGTFRIGQISTPVGAMAGAVMSAQSGRTGDIRNLITAGQTSGASVSRNVNAGGDPFLDNANCGGAASCAPANSFSVVRRSPAIQYVSPTFSGVTGTLWYELPEQKNGTATGSPVSRKPSVLSGTVTYSAGPLLAGIGYQQHRGLRFDTNAPVGSRNDLKDRIWAFGGSYDFKVVKVGVVHSRLNTGDSAAVADQPLDNNMRAWGINVTAPVGNGEVQVGYARQKWTDNGAWDQNDSKQFTLGYQHNLSKRTSLVAAYSKITNEARKGHGFYINPNSFNNNVTSAASAGLAGAATAGQDPRLLSLGLRHSF